MATVDRRWSVEWERTNPILGNGEIGQDKSSGRIKIGDGKTRWLDLSFLPSSSSTPVVTPGGTVDLTGYAKLTDLTTAVGTRVAEADFRERVEDAIAQLLASGTGVTLNYEDNGDGNGKLTLTAASGGGGTTDPEVVRDVVGVALVGAGLINVAINDPGDTITFTTTATANSTDAQLRNRQTHTGDYIIEGTNLKTVLDTKINLADIEPATDVATQQDITNKIDLLVEATGLGVVAGSGSVELAWKAPRLLSGVTDYRIQYKLTSATSWTTWTHTASTATTATITGLTDGSSYDFRVAVIRDGVVGADTPAISSTPSAAQPTFYDTFSTGSTLTSGRVLPNGTNATGATWQVDTASTSTPPYEILILNDVAKGGAGGNAIVYSTFDMASTVRRLQIRWKDLLGDTVKRRAYTIFRYQNESNHWRIYSHTSGNYSISKFVAGANTVVFSSTVPAAANDVISVLPVAGGFSVYVNGVLLQTVSDTALASYTRAGFALLPLSSSNETYDRVSSVGEIGAY